MHHWHRNLVMMRLSWERRSFVRGQLESLREQSELEGGLMISLLREGRQARKGRGGDGEKGRGGSDDLCVRLREVSKVKVTIFGRKGVVGINGGIQIVLGLISSI